MLNGLFGGCEAIVLYQLTELFTEIYVCIVLHCLLYNFMLRHCIHKHVYFRFIYCVYITCIESVLAPLTHCYVRRKLTTSRKKITAFLASQDTSVLPLASHELWNDDAFVEAAIDTWTFL